MKSVPYKLMVFTVISLGITINLMSCREKNNKIPYRSAEGYFVLNTIENAGAYEKKFTTKDEFDRYFGSATTMNSSSTPIDFDKEFAIAFIAPITDMETDILVDSVLQNGNQTEIYLSIETGKTMSYSIRPVKILVIDRKYNGELTSFVNRYKTKN